MITQRESLDRLQDLEELTAKVIAMNRASGARADFPVLSLAQIRTLLDRAASECGRKVRRIEIAATGHIVVVLSAREVACDGKTLGIIHQPTVLPPESARPSQPAEERLVTSIRVAESMPRNGAANLQGLSMSCADSTEAVV